MSRRKKRNSANKYMVQSDEPPPCPHAEKSITPNKVTEGVFLNYVFLNYVFFNYVFLNYVFLDCISWNMN